MAQNTIVDSIKALPHWRFVFRPKPYVADRLERNGVLRAVRKATVQFRGWDFPHMNPHEKPGIGPDYVSSSDQFMGHLEYWRAFASGQFVYLSSVREATEPGWRERLARGAAHRITPPSPEYSWESTPGFIEVGNLIYTITEFVEFSARYAQTLPGVETTHLAVSLSAIQGFVLMVDDVRRGWWDFYEATADKLSRSEEYELAELVVRSRDIAFDLVKWFLVSFGWFNLNEAEVRKEIEGFVR